MSRLITSGRSNSAVKDTGENTSEFRMNLNLGSLTYFLKNYVQIKAPADVTQSPPPLSHLQFSQCHIVQDMVSSMSKVLVHTGARRIS